MEKDKEIKEKINKLKIALNHTMKKWNNQKKIMNSNVFSNFEKSTDTLQVRNMVYTNNVIKKVNNNLVDIEDELNKSSKDKSNSSVNDKFNVSFMLLQSVCDVGNKYSLKDYDYEIMSLKTINSKLDNIGKNNRGDKHFEDKKTKILEQFNSVKVEVIEGFDFSPVVDIIDEIGDGFKMVIDGIVKIGKFVGELLKDFVILLFTLLKMLYNFIIKIIPEIIKFFYNLIIGIYQRGLKVGITTILFFFGFKEYLQYFSACMLIPVLVKLAGTEDDFGAYMSPASATLGQNTASLSHDIVEGRTCHPTYYAMAGTSSFILSFLTSVYIFWFKTEYFEYINQLGIEFLLTLFNGPLKKIFAYILGVKEDDDLFSETNWRNPAQIARKIQLLGIYISKDLVFCGIRFISLVLMGAICYKFLYLKHMKYMVPNMRQICLFPFIVINDILKFSGIINLLPPYGD